ncbi:MAG TPA: Holliday junction resolvase RuvX [Ktedonobacterales bacterium]|nr:Holliday junction resolvase RuvX [Ktedonobacterales bacterium]
MVVLALDVGQARIGVAVGDESGVLASPHGVVRRRSNAAAIAEIERLYRAAGATALVIGLPISLDDRLHGQAHAVQEFGRRVAAALGVAPIYWDERYSTVTAAERLRAAGVKPARIKERIDAVAAAIILQEYLDDARQRSGALQAAAAADGDGDERGPDGGAARGGEV